MVEEFPPVTFADPDSGLLAIGGDLEVGTLELAYRSGIFPWPHEDGEPVCWFAPPQRAVLRFSDLKVPRRLPRSLRRARFTFAVDRDFPAVIQACAESKNRGEQAGTWITTEMIGAYVDLHRAGCARSFETYDQTGNLVGGMYGVQFDQYFAGESMFFKQTDASKFALLQGIEYLKSLGLSWMDIQMLTPLLQNFGAKEIPRNQFMQMLATAVSKEVR